MNLNTKCNQLFNLMNLLNFYEFVFYFIVKSIDLFKYKRLNRFSFIFTKKILQFNLFDTYTT